MTTAKDDLVARLRANFEGREAIDVEKGALRVRVTGVWADPARRAVGAVVEEIPTRGFERSAFHAYADEPAPLRWDIGSGYLTEFGELLWAAGYCGWELYFAPHVIEGRCIAPCVARLSSLYRAATTLGTPAGLPLMASHGRLLRVERDTLGYDADTVGGFSGTAAVDSRLLVQGVHYSGSCDESETSDGANLATPMHAVLDRDPVLRTLIAGDRCGRGASDCLCRAGDDTRAQGRCFDGNLDCSRCVSEAIEACCGAEVGALRSCARAAGCNDDACVSARCASHSGAVNTCWSSARRGDGACLGAFANCFGQYPVLCD